MLFTLVTFLSPTFVVYYVLFAAVSVQPLASSIILPIAVPLSHYFAACESGNLHSIFKPLSLVHFNVTYQGPVEIARLV